MIVSSKTDLYDRMHVFKQNVVKNPCLEKLK